MAGLFDRVKSLVNITEYIALEAGVDAKRSGSGSFRINPCPICGHNDCFTINEKDQFFKCFSCSAKGDVIEFEQQYRKMESPLEAAKSIAGKRGIPILEQEDGGRPTAPATRKPEKKPEAEKVEIENSIRAFNVRLLSGRE